MSLSQVSPAFIGAQAYVTPTYSPPPIAPTATTLQPWTTLTASSGITSITQDQDQWLDLTPFSDVAVWIEGVIPTGTLYLETSPTLDEANFQPICPRINTGTGASAVTVVRSARCATAVPLARWLRWRLAGNLGGGGQVSATFRIHVIPFRQSFFIPPQVPGCVLFFRSDLAISPGWNDESATADANQNLGQVNGLYRPVFSTTPGSFNGQPTLGLASYYHRYMTSAGTWASALQQPSTWVLVANNTGVVTTAQYIVDSNDSTGTTGQTITYVPSTTTLALTAGGSSFSTTASWASAGALLAEFNGASSNIYLNNFTTATATGTLGGNPSGEQVSMTLGSQNASSGGPGSYWDGSVAEVIAYKRILSASEKAQLRSYLNARYALSIL